MRVLAIGITVSVLLIAGNSSASDVVTSRDNQTADRSSYGIATSQIPADRTADGEGPTWSELYNSALYEQKTICEYFPLEIAGETTIIAFTHLKNEFDGLYAVTFLDIPVDANYVFSMVLGVKLSDSTAYILMNTRYRGSEYFSFDIDDSLELIADGSLVRIGNVSNPMSSVNTRVNGYRVEIESSAIYPMSRLLLRKIYTAETVKFRMRGMTGNSPVFVLYDWQKRIIRHFYERYVRAFSAIRGLRFPIDEIQPVAP